MSSVSNTVTLEWNINGLSSNKVTLIWNLVGRIDRVIEMIWNLDNKSQIMTPKKPTIVSIKKTPQMPTVISIDHRGE